MPPVKHLFQDLPYFRSATEHLTRYPLSNHNYYISLPDKTGSYKIHQQKSLMPLSAYKLPICHVLLKDNHAPLPSYNWLYTLRADNLLLHTFHTPASPPHLACTCHKVQNLPRLPLSIQSSR